MRHAFSDKLALKRPAQIPKRTIQLNHASPRQGKGGADEKENSGGTFGRSVCVGWMYAYGHYALADTTPPADAISTGASLHSYCTESQREFLEQTQEELPVELVFHHWTETAADYKTTDETVISGVLQALRDVTVVSRSPIVSTDNRGLTFVTAQGDTCSFWFDERRFEGVDGACYVLSGDEKLWELVWGIRDADPEYQDLMR